MTQDAGIVAARALKPWLDSFHQIHGLTLQGVRKLYAHGSTSRLILDFGRSALMIQADPADDTVDLAVVNDGLGDGNLSDVSGSELWSKFIGQPFGWGWLAINQQGYCDSVLLSFDGIVPQVLLNIMASSIKENAISRVKPEQE